MKEMIEWLNKNELFQEMGNERSTSESLKTQFQQVYVLNIVNLVTKLFIKIIKQMTFFFLKLYNNYNNLFVFLYFSNFYEFGGARC